MNHKLQIFCVICFFFLKEVKSQMIDPPNYIKAGKCYKRNLDFDKKFECKAIDCDSLKKTNNNITNEQLMRFKDSLTNYQKKLKELGYDIEVNGIPDQKTTYAHHKYLKKRNRTKKRKARKREQLF